MTTVLDMRTAESKLKKAGFELTTGGRHRKWKHPDGRTVTLPNARQGTVLWGWLGQSVERMLVDDTGKRKRGQ